MKRQMSWALLAAGIALAASTAAVARSHQSVKDRAMAAGGSLRGWGGGKHEVSA
jgi:hypothetical protein